MTEAAVWVPPSPVYPLAFTGLGGPNPIIGGRFDLMGWTMAEATGAAAVTWQLFDGADASGQAIALRKMSAGDTITDWFGAPGIRCLRGLFLQQIVGIVNGTVYVRYV